MSLRCGLMAALLVSATDRVDAAPPLEVYGQLPGFETASISPSGDRYAVVGVIGEDRKLGVVAVDGTPLLLQSIGDRKVSGLDFADDDHLVVVTHDTYKLGAEFVRDQAELRTAVVINVAARSMTPVLKRDQIFGGIADYYGTARDGDHVYGLFSAITLGKTRAGDQFWNGNAPDLYRVDLKTNESIIIARHSEGSTSRDWLVDASGKVAATLEENSISHRWTLRDAAGSDVARGADPVRVALAALGTTPGQILYYSGTENGLRCCAQYPAAPAPLFADMDIGGVLTKPGTRVVVGYVTEEDHPQAHFLDPRYEARMRGVRKAFPGLDVRLVDASTSFDRMIVKTTGDTDSGTWWLVDIKTGSAKPIGRSYPKVQDADVGHIQMVHWTAADGLPLAGVLTTPPGRAAKSLPLIMLPHGGPAARDYPTFDWWAQALAAQGYAVFQPNFRGSTGYGEAFNKTGNGEWGGKMLSDVASGIAALAQSGTVDPKRVCIVGGSYGGYAALAGVSLQRGFYRCAVAVAPVTDLASFFAWTSNGSDEARVIARHWRTMIGSQPPAELSPAARAAEVEVPVLLIQGTSDTVVPFEQSKLMETRLKRAGKPVELLTLPGGDHWLSQGATRTAMLQATVAFVRKHNPPD